MKRIAYLLVAYLLIGCSGGGGGGGVDATNGMTPLVNVASATSVGIDGATLNGNVTPNGLATNAWFEWGTDTVLSTPTSTPAQSIGSGLSIIPVSFQIAGLAENTKYYFRVCASNAKGEIVSAIISFTTSSSGSAPMATTLSATSVAATTATLNGNVTPNGLATSAWFEYGTDPNLVSPTSTSSQSVGSGTTSQSVSAALTGLSTGTTYYVRVAASNSSGTSQGTIVSFTLMTPPIAPTNVQALIGGSYTLPPNPTIYFMNVIWRNNSSNQDGVAIEMGTYPWCTNFAEIGRVGPGVSSYTQQVGRPHYGCYRVRAFNAAGYSPYSANATGIYP